MNININSNCLLFVAFLFVLSSCGDDPILKAKKLIEEGNNEAAIELLKSVKQTGTNGHTKQIADELLEVIEAPVNFQKAEQHFEKKNWDDALVLYKKIPENTQEHSKAEERISKILQLKRAVTTENFLKAEKYFKKRKWDDALAWYKKIPEDAQEFPKAEERIEKTYQLKRTISAEKIAKEYTWSGQSALKADMKYKDERIIVNGKLAGVKRKNPDIISTLMWTPYSINIVCDFDESWAEELSNTKRMQRITVEGLFKGQTGLFNNVYLEDCSLL